MEVTNRIKPNYHPLAQKDCLSKWEVYLFLTNELSENRAGHASVCPFCESEIEECMDMWAALRTPTLELSPEPQPLPNYSLKVTAGWVIIILVGLGYILFTASPGY